MTTTPATTSEMDHLDQLGAKAFAGFLVRKELVRKDSRQYPVPTYVVEFLLGRYSREFLTAALLPGAERSFAAADVEGSPCSSGCPRRW
jgi:hypothetical protein